MSEMKSETIYVVEDHAAILYGITQYLELAGYEVKGLSDLKSAEREISLKAPDILIQDVMLPDGDGFMF
ncbi:MAG: response regulator, partial [Sphaerochaetaceae bacterium]